MVSSQSSEISSVCGENPGAAAELQQAWREYAGSCIIIQGFEARILNVDEI
jgi:hypothetical protein